MHLTVSMAEMIYLFSTETRSGAQVSGSVAVIFDIFFDAGTFIRVECRLKWVPKFRFTLIAEIP